ncbi:exopolysaccharide biosynthesis polyprenyl glycosylphosphotransferase [Nocardioides sp. LS1]|uniref:exopolysaccharide biosynthesis polyprenyl glycosylphosphotransferase n=1 Tax=Nocardioides sp. LS1 TaxID=1027620 RepID=UPI000FF9983F|nr:exopolysaccharide biosynthesis polyprenyl glycosylphosphotransferase [Nocardioides sp. LS1]GCD91348.1 hypothetical protein NLS1_33540 [Nocardioides sp. LS1]
MTATVPLGPEAATSRHALRRLVRPLSIRGTRQLPAAGAASTRPARTPWALVPGDALAALVVSAVTLPAGPSTGTAAWLLLAAVTATWLALLGGTGAFEARRATSATEDLRRIARAGVGLAAATPLIVTMSGQPLEPWRVLVVAVAVSALAVGLRRAGTALRPPDPVRVVVSGPRPAVDLLLRELAADRRPAFVVVGIHEPATGRDLPTTAQRLGAEAVVVLPTERDDPAALRRLGWQLERAGTQVLIATGLLDVASHRTRLEYAGALPLLRVRHPDTSGGRRRAKAVADRVAAAVALVVLAPLLLAIGVAVRVESSGPAFFRQTRVGCNGVPFTMLKFRTMGLDAECRREELTAREAVEGVLFKMRCDPRVTRVGAVLRRYSLDELPQLVNVLRGQMSLVGPRPPLPSEVEQYAPDVHRRLAVKPGLTGLWQVSGRSDLSWEESVRLDLRYVDNWSLGSDLRIVWRTVGAVLGHRGAY